MSRFSQEDFEAYQSFSGSPSRGNNSSIGIGGSLQAATTSQRGGDRSASESGEVAYADESDFEELEASLRESGPVGLSSMEDASSMSASAMPTPPTAKPPTAPPPQKASAAAPPRQPSSAAQEASPFEGQWRMDSGDLAHVRGAAVVWSDGSRSSIIGVTATSMCVRDEGQECTAVLQGGKLCWDDGDVWQRVEAAGPAPPLGGNGGGSDNPSSSSGGGSSPSPPAAGSAPGRGGGGRPSPPPPPSSSSGGHGDGRPAGGGGRAAAPLAKDGGSDHAIALDDDSDEFDNEVASATGYSR